jgi:hypothetical protein
VYFADLTPYEYLKTNEPAALNVGWLETENEFSRGKVSDVVIERLKSLAKRPINQTRGFHLCPFCKNETGDFNARMERIVKIGAASSAKIRVIGRSGLIYAAPVLICHYIEIHDYQSPREFVEAVMENY